MALKQSCHNLVQSVSRQKVLDSSPSETTLNRCLTAVDLTAIGISSTLGAGLYVLAGDVAHYTAGPGIVLSFFIAAVASILSALCYTEFASKIPKAGTAYVYSYVMIGELVAFIIGWNLVLEFAIGEASVARAFSAYLQSLTGISVTNATSALFGEIHVYGLSPHLDFISLFLCILISIALSFGIKYSAKFNSFLTGLNLAIVVVVISVGLFYVKGQNWSNFAPYGITGIIDGASTCFFAYIGFDVIATTAEEAQNPAKAIPISILGTISICFTAYFGVSAVLTLMVPYSTLSGDSALVSAFDSRGAHFAKYVIGTGAGLSLLGTTITSLLPMPRLLYAMSSDGLLPPIFSKVNKGTSTPIFSTIFSGIFAGLMALVLDLHELVEMLSIGTLLAYSIVTICVLILRYDTVELKGMSTPSQFEEAKRNITESDKEALFKFEGVFSEGDGYEREASRETERSRVLIAKALILGIVLLLFALDWLLAFHNSSIKETRIFVLVILFTCAVVIGTISLSRFKQNDQTMPFKVPLVPFIPILSLFVNIYLILRLKKITWIRLAVWLLIGLVIYFTYGIWHSVHREVHFEGQVEGYIPLQSIDEDAVKQKIPEKEKKPGLYPTLEPLSKD